MTTKWQYRFFLLPKYCELCAIAGRPPRFWISGYQHRESTYRWRCPECHRAEMWSEVGRKLRQQREEVEA
jgi:hypothetical protein